MGSEAETTLTIVLLALAGIIVLGRLAVLLADRCQQPSAVGEICGGVLAGTLIMQFWPSGMKMLQGDPGMVLEVLAQLGIVLMMFQIGLEFDFRLLRQPSVRRSVLAITAAGMVVPFLLGAAVALCYASFRGVTDPWGLAWLCGLTLAVTALPILGRILVEHGWQETRLGITVISVAGLNDVATWTMMGALLIYLSDRSMFELLGQLVGISAFLGIVFGLRPLLLRWAARTGEDFAVLWVYLVGTLLAAVATAQLGLFAVVGAFIFGASLYTSRRLLVTWNERISPVVNIALVPVFFVYSGMQIDWGLFRSSTDLLWVLPWAGAAFLGKVGACAWAARWSGHSRQDALRIGALLNTRALMGLVVLNVARELALMPPHLYASLVLVVMLSTLSTAPLIKWIGGKSAPSNTDAPLANNPTDPLPQGIKKTT